MSPTFEVGRELTGTARSVLTGEDVQLLGEALIDGKLQVALDAEADEGQSGSVFVDEENSRMYVLRARSPWLTRELKERMADGPKAIKHGVTFAVRLAYA